MEHEKLNFARFFRNLPLIARCLFLFVKNAVLFRKLCVERVWLDESILVTNEEIILNLEVYACYLIKIKNIAAFPGNSRSIRVCQVDLSKPIEICFYGIRETVRRSITLSGTKISVIQTFAPSLSLPLPANILAEHKSLRTYYSDSDLKMNFTEFSIELEKFDPEKYRT